MIQIVPSVSQNISVDSSPSTPIQTIQCSTMGLLAWSLAARSRQGREDVKGEPRGENSAMEEAMTKEVMDELDTVVNTAVAAVAEV